MPNECNDAPSSSFFSLNLSETKPRGEKKQKPWDIFQTVAQNEADHRGKKWGKLVGVTSSLRQLRSREFVVKSSACGSNYRFMGKYIPLTVVSASTIIM